LLKSLLVAGKLATFKLDTCSKDPAMKPGTLALTSISHVPLWDSPKMYYGSHCLDYLGRDCWVFVLEVSKDRHLRQMCHVIDEKGRAGWVFTSALVQKQANGAV